MSVIEEKYTLSNGVEIPKLGLGTWFVDDDKASQAVRDAVKIGYRNIDTAQAYGNERGVGEGIRTADIPREDLFVSTKLAAEIKNYDEAVKAIDGSLETMGLDYVDLMLIHSPQPWGDFRGGDYSEGKIRAIGVSNFLESDLNNILDSCSVKPLVNQLLVHVGNTPHELLSFCASNDILVEAYSPIAHGEMLKNKDVAEIAEKYGVSIPQLCIRYTLQLGTVSLPKTANPDHMQSNVDVGFVISDEEMDALKKLDARDYGESSQFPVYSGK